MAPLYGRLNGQACRKEVTRVGFEDVQSKLETWHGSIHTMLFRDGTYKVYVGSKSSPTTLIAEGQIDA